MTKPIAFFLGLISGLVLAIPAGADDTEVFETQYTGVDAGSGRAKVLIIFDDSGSMDEGVAVRPPYDPDIDWTDDLAIEGVPDDFRGPRDELYWSIDGTPPDNKDSRFAIDLNRCQTAVAQLAQAGFYTDSFRVWRENPNAAPRTEEWLAFDNRDHIKDALDMECAADIDSNDQRNPGAADGWASNAGGPFRTDVAGDPWDTYDKRHAGGLERTLFTRNYLAWYNNDQLYDGRTKMEIAQDVVSDLVANNPQVDFGLMAFNRNNLYDPNVDYTGNELNGDNNGGRVIRHLQQMDNRARDSMVDLIATLQPGGNTPLCETLYEAYRYIAKPGGAAQTVFFGDDDPNSLPPSDACAEDADGAEPCTRSGTYNSPLGDCETIRIVIMTDGKPYYDLEANDLVRALAGVGSCGNYLSNNNELMENCMPEMAKYLHEHDLDDVWENGEQPVTTYTIGFLTDQQLLHDTAELGGGTYHTANDADELAAAFQATLVEILSDNSSFAAPAVAVNAYSRTKSLDSEYLALFLPGAKPRWPGNLKKLKFAIANDGVSEVLVDAAGLGAIDAATGDISGGATTFWTTSGIDGMEVEQGGAGERLILRNPNQRVLLTNTGDAGALEDFDPTNDRLTAALFGAADAAERDRFVQWAMGIDVSDEDQDGSSTDTRPWIMGDIIHSTPEAINFGNPLDPTAPDVRVVFGTNAGFLHMIENATGDESWAFFPKELASIVPVLYANESADDHPYGIDGSPAVWLKDRNHDGNIVAGDGDLAYVFVGLRRGSRFAESAGGGYYALDISDPDSPGLLWQIGNNDLPELGQTWSTPSPTFVPGHANPVIVIGAGYDTAKDVLEDGPDDSKGRGIYILDAVDGSLVWGVTPGANTAKNLSEPGLEDSVPAQVTVFDSNGDHVTDRIYFPDTGANIWRVDLVDEDPSNWSIYKLAELGGDGRGSNRDERRFMNRIDVVTTRYGDLAYDALLIGSGDRAHPLERDVENRFYMLRDFGTRTALHVPNDGDDDVDACENNALNPDELPCAEIPEVITERELVEATDNDIQDGRERDIEHAQEDLASIDTMGWYIELEAEGEKSLARAVTLQGHVFFTTFVPPQVAGNGRGEEICRPRAGTGFLYGVGLHDAAAVYHWTSDVDAALTKADRSKQIKQQIPGQPVPYFGKEVGLVGVGAGRNASGIEPTGMTLSARAVYWMQDVD